MKSIWIKTDTIYALQYDDIIKPQFACGI